MFIPYLGGRGTNRILQSNPPQGMNGRRRGAHRGKGAHRRRVAPRGRGGPGGRGGPKGRAAPRPHSSHKTHPLRKPIIENSPHRPPPPDSCYESRASWEECIENQLIPKRTPFKTHHTRHIAERQGPERDNDYQGTEIDPPNRPPRRHNVKRGPSHSQSKSLYISRLVRYL